MFLPNLARRIVLQPLHKQHNCSYTIYRPVIPARIGYIDPYAGDGYDLPADLILVSHGHPDHNAVDLINNRKDDCQIIYNTDALIDGEYKTFDLGFATVEAV